MRLTSNTITIENTVWKHVHPLRITIFQIGSGYARPANQLHDPIVLGNAPIAPTREDLWCFLTLFEVHIGHAHWTSFNCKDDAPDAVVNVRLYSLVLDSCMLNCFCKPALGSQVSASQLMRSTRQRERKTCHFGPYPHPITFDFTRWTYTWKLWFTFTLPTAGIMISCAHL